MRVALHQAVLFRGLRDKVTVFLNGAAEPNNETWEQLAALGVSVAFPGVERLVMQDDAPGGTPEPTPFGTQIPTGARGVTPVPGVWAAGNASQPMAMVSAAAASGVTAGAGVHGELLMADLAVAVEECRHL